MTQSSQPSGRRKLDNGDSMFTASIACGLISLFIGGVPLSIVAFVLAIIGAVRFRDFQQSSDAVDNGGFLEKKPANMRKLAIAFIVSVIAVVLNIVSYIILLPVIMDFIENGDLSTLMNAYTQGDIAQVPSGSNGTWG